MPKAENGYDLERYAPVARRISLFYERYPAGRIITTLVERDARAVIFRARIYRTAEEGKPGGDRLGPRARGRWRRERRCLSRKHRDVRHRTRTRKPRLHRERRASESRRDGARSQGAAGAASRGGEPPARDVAGARARGAAAVARRRTRRRALAARARAAGGDASRARVAHECAPAQRAAGADRSRAHCEPTARVDPQTARREN